MFLCFQSFDWVLSFCFDCGMIVVLGLVVIFYFLLILPRWVVVDVGRGYLGKSAFTTLSSPDFPPDLEGWKLWARERKLSPGFSFLPIFSPLPNSGKHCFPPYFPLYVFHPLYFHSNQTQCKWIEKKIKKHRKVKNFMDLNNIYNVKMKGGCSYGSSYTTLALWRNLKAHLWVWRVKMEKERC